MKNPIRLFDETSLHKLENLTFSQAAIRVGAMKGDRRSRKKGTSIEFADYRNYAQGDDLRRLDWNIYARLDRPLIKVTHDEEDLAIHIMVDTSSSMNWPMIEDSPTDRSKADTNKLVYGLRVAGALGYIGLAEGDVVAISLTDNANKQTWGPFRSRQNGWPLVHFLEANLAKMVNPAKQATSRKIDLDLSLREYALRATRPGLFFLISDLFPSNPDRLNPLRDGLQALRSRGYEPAVIQILSPDEVAPETGGDLKLIDSETGEDADVTLDATVLQAYIDRLQTWQEEIHTHCRSRHVRFISTVTDKAWDYFILQALHQEGVIN
jgi:hypothetical protein